jgi:hypothetical protein
MYKVKLFVLNTVISIFSVFSKFKPTKPKIEFVSRSFGFVPTPTSGRFIYSFFYPFIHFIPNTICENLSTHTSNFKSPRLDLDFNNTHFSLDTISKNSIIANANLIGHKNSLFKTLNPDGIDITDIVQICVKQENPFTFLEILHTTTLSPILGNEPDLIKIEILHDDTFDITSHSLDHLCNSFLKSDTKTSTSDLL